ncbi:NAD(P)-binding protein [Metschnikowia bicuspidata var. bicuspidata NRRL YB-4993]|uniref:NAD(P)-binding protein n=1 Tax=Metschnikowia bicuspidata var. bicuspidata NRRL YB-4993 TaxID=869754 RepID=A0A1A0HHM3_9ASCO|nr:NAD(P)-binding protein [Metschnikowia bicuspidata var. bicuspidata NRRL YB-4993]OBA23505.1 NAD(P)-binding protein [Metschnikowia bicuspidata var. bicuspidata NRRL YB-4993]
MTRQKVALITGASSGIGHATAIEFAKRGYKTYACARRLEPMEPLKREGIITVTCDVTLGESVALLRDRIAQENDGFLDVLFNNAGQSCSFPAIDVSDDNVAKCFQVNVFAPVRLTREFAALLIKAKGTVGFTGSVAGLVAFPFSSIYAASKAAIHQYVATLRLEMKPFGVKVLNFVTGGVNTNIADTRDLPEDSWYQVPGIQEAFSERREMAKRNHPMSVEKYAFQVVNDFERQTLGGRLNLYRGLMAVLLGGILPWFPRFIVEKIFVTKFKLAGVFNFITEKYAKTKLA